MNCMKPNQASSTFKGWPDILNWNVTPLLLKEIEILREQTLRAIFPIESPDSDAQRGKLLWEPQRTKAGRDLAHYYLVYFLFVDLLRFRNFGKSEKIAWSIPIYFEGTTYLIDHRKFGVGIFCENPDAHENQAKRIVSLISKGVKVADPFFRSLADDAVCQSRVNVKNNSASLFHLWSGPRPPAWTYIQDADLPLILTLASDGTYEDAMQSVEDMERFAHGLTMQFDNAANMDW